MSTSDDRVGVALYTTYLRLINVTEEAEGAYQCGFQNEFGQDYSSNVPLQVLGMHSYYSGHIIPPHSFLSVRLLF